MTTYDIMLKNASFQNKKSNIRFLPQKFDFVQSQQKTYIYGAKKLLVNDQIYMYTKQVKVEA